MKIKVKGRAKVVHWRKEAFDVYVGRPTRWGNPFKPGPDGTRKVVIEKYRAWLMARPALVARAKRELRGKILGCWCHPSPCHASVLLEVANG